MSEPPLATPETTENLSVGDIRRVPAEGNEGNDFHHIELRDPEGRIGLVFNCRLCGKWFASYGVFQSEPCFTDKQWNEYIVNE